MTERPDSARRGLTIDEAQAILLERAQAASRALPEIPHPNLAQSFIPTLGPAWDAAADFQDENYGGAALNGAIAVTDAFGAGVVGKGLKAASKGILPWKTGSLTDNAARKAYRKAGMVETGEETHHMFGFKGMDRKAPNWRNNYMFLKPLPQETHRRLTGKWGDLERFGPLQRLWHGTTDWAKIAPPALAGRSADLVDNLNRPRSTGQQDPRARQKR